MEKHLTALQAATGFQMKTRHIACLFRGSRRDLAKQNTRRTYLHGKSFPALHAEHHAMLPLTHRKRGQKMKKKRHSLLVIRLLPSGKLGNSRPCNHCVSLMRQVGLKKVYYSNQEGNIVMEKVQGMLALHQSQGFEWLQSSVEVRTAPQALNNMPPLGVPTLSTGNPLLCYPLTVYLPP